MRERLRLRDSSESALNSGGTVIMNGEDRRCGRRMGVSGWSAVHFIHHEIRWNLAGRMEPGQGSACSSSSPPSPSISSRKREESQQLRTQSSSLTSYNSAHPSIRPSVLLSFFLPSFPPSFPPSFLPSFLPS